MGARDGMSVLRDSFDDEFDAIRVVGIGPVWRKYTLDFAALAAAAADKAVIIYALPPGGVVHDAKLKHSAAFSGGAINAYTVEVGLVGSTEKYVAPLNVFQAPGDTVLGSGKGRFIENHGAATDIIVTAKSAGANLDAATAGSVDIWLLTSKVV